ncbi:MAG: M48 family metalloprotease [Candidatus Methanomethylophilaceae archaeon]
MGLWRLKTLFMFTYMTLLLLIIGALVSWFFRFDMFIGLGVMMVFSLLLCTYSYFNCKKSALRANNARIIQEYEEPRLYNTVKKVAELAGVPMPEVGIVETPVPNAFATGRKPSDAAVVATRGLLNMLDDDELAGVIAHEMAHVRNRDILVMTIASMMASMITYVSNMLVYMAMFSGNDRDNNGLAVIGALLAHLLMPLAAMLVQLGISRNREFLADATGARIIHNPRALARALARIGGFDMKSYEEAKVMEYRRGKRNDDDPYSPTSPKSGDIYECAHMWISNPLKGRSMASLFSTHPDMEERIRRLNEMADKGDY